MKMWGLLKSWPARFTALGTVAVLAGSIALPATAMAAPVKTCDLACVIAFGDQRIAVRETALTNLSTRLNDHLTKGRLTSAQAAPIQNDISTDEAALTALKAKIDADTTVAAARADVKSIYTQYRIFAVVLPRDYRMMWIDIMTNIDQKLRSLQPKIDWAIAHAPASEQAQLNQWYSDFRAQLSEAESQLDAAHGQMGTLTVANFNSDRSVYESALTDLKGDLQTAHRDIKQAAGDLHQIVRMLKSNESGTSSTTTNPAATATANS